METKKLGNYTLDILDVTEFKKYYYDNENSFSTIAYNSFLKALDIPPKFFKEQPLETRKELLENREVFVREAKKFFNKVIIVVRYEDRILNACRLDRVEVERRYEKLKTIEQVENKFEHRSFMKDGYISYIVGTIAKDKSNQVIAIDFPILMNKNVVIHNALYTLPNDTFATPVEHIQYLTSTEVDLYDCTSLKDVIDSQLGFLSEELPKVEAEDILREPEIVALALQESGSIPKAHTHKMSDYILEHAMGCLTTTKLESLVLDFDENFNSYKQVTSLRSISGKSILNLLESPSFKELVEEMDKVADELEASLV